MGIVHYLKANPLLRLTVNNLQKLSKLWKSDEGSNESERTGCVRPTPFQL
jgi:hypothetical protein